MLQLFWEISEGWLLSNQSWMLMRCRITYLPRLCTWAAILLPGSVDSEQTKKPQPPDVPLGGKELNHVSNDPIFPADTQNIALFSGWSWRAERTQHNLQPPDSH